MRVARMLVVGLSLTCLTGCEVILSAYVEKDWRTDTHLYDKPDAKSRIEVKVVKQIGADAKKK